MGRLLHIRHLVPTNVLLIKGSGNGWRWSAVGTAAAYAKALGRSADAAALQSTVSDIYSGDEIATRLAERLEESAAT